MLLTWKRMVSVALLALAGGLVALVPSPNAASASPRCTTAGLVVWLDTQGGGAAGSVYYRLQLTNLSGHACTLAGFPGVSAVDLHGHQLGSAASRDRTTPLHSVTLGSGRTARAVLRIVQAANYPAARCGLVTAAGLRVYPPGQTASKVVPFPFSACSRRGPIVLSVRAVS